MLMHCEWIMDERLDSACAQPLAQRLALGRAYDVQVVDVGPAARYWNGAAAQRLGVAARELAPSGVPTVEAGQLREEDRSLDRVEPALSGALEGAPIVAPSVLAQLAGPRRHDSIGGYHCARVAECSEILRRIEAERRDVRDHRHPVRLCGILDDT